MRKIVKPLGVFWTKPHSTHPSILTKLQNEIFFDKKFREISQSLELLNSESRLRLLLLLSMKESLCVGDIAGTLRLSTSATSHQLRILRQEKLLVSRKKGKLVYYSLSKELPRVVNTVLRA